MSDYDNTNRFVLFINNRKEGEKDPDRTGTLNVNGVEFYMDGWIQQGAKGPFLSGRIKPKKAGPDRQQSRPAKPIDPDEDVPFN